MIDLAKLSAPFSPAAVSWRIGSTTADKTKGMALAYLDARDVMDRLDEVCGPGGWQATYPHAGQKTVCSIGILCGEHWVWKSNGAGDSDIEAEKGALSDAFKRAAVLWGVGRYLYSLPSPWVEIETRGRTSFIKNTEYGKLAAVLAKHTGAPVAPTREPDPPPQSMSQDPDVAAGNLRWVGQQKELLKTLLNEESVKTWARTNKKAIEKLERDNAPLFGDLKKAYDDALDRVRARAA